MPFPATLRREMHHTLNIQASAKKCRYHFSSPSSVVELEVAYLAMTAAVSAIHRKAKQTLPYLARTAGKALAHCRADTERIVK